MCILYRIYLYIYISGMGLRHINIDELKCSFTRPRTKSARPGRHGLQMSRPE